MEIHLRFRVCSRDKAEKSDTEREKPISGHGERGSRESRDEEREERGQPPLPPPARRNRVSSGESCAGAMNVLCMFKRFVEP